ncbi:Brachyury 2 [Apodemus speciosus]|uniref:Brachyury 2 n=1 Tax=Apodemus speciosus TaxID=105296 RepID=A0ABQ0FMN9_APOSI
MQVLSRGSQNGGNDANSVKLPRDCVEDLRSKRMCKARTDSQGKMYLSRLYQMYFTSLANMEFSRRGLLERDGRFADMDAEHRAGSLIGLHGPKRTSAGRRPTKRTGGGGVPSPWPAASSRTCPPISKVPEPRKSTETSPPEDRKTPSDPVWHRSKRLGHERGTLAPARVPTEHVRDKHARAGVTPDPRPTAPLTLTSVIQTHPVVEAKTASRYWVNYVDEE